MKGLPLPLSYLLLSFLFVTYGYSQTSISVSDSITGLPLIGVQVYSSTHSYADVTDHEGKVTLPNLPSSVEVTLSYIGYKTVCKRVHQLVADRKVLMHPGLELDEVEVVGRDNTKSKDILNKVERISSDQIVQSQSQNSAEALEKNAGVYIQRSQLGGGSPILRGFEANRVLLVVDGVRMNNAIYRSGHLQNAISVGAATLEDLEVIYGPGSLMYGSDALGGVVHFKTKSPTYRYLDNTPPSEGSFLLRGSTMGNYSVHGDVTLRASKLASLTSVSYSHFADLKAGSRKVEKYPAFGTRPFYVERKDSTDIITQNKNPYLQVGTGYNQLDILQKIKYKVNESLDFTANAQYSTTSDVPRYDALTELEDGNPKWAEWYYGPQQRSLISLTTNYSPAASSLADNVTVIIGQQTIAEDRISRKFQRPERQHQEEDLKVYSATIDAYRQAGDLMIKYGFEFNSNLLTSTAYNTDANTYAETSKALTRYPSGGAKTRSFGTYIYLSQSVSSKTNIITGIRYSNSYQKVKYDRADALTWPDEFYKGISNQNQAFTWAAGANHHSDNWQIRLMAGSSFRAPNIDDLAKIRVKRGEVQVPNLNLNPEKATNLELNATRALDHIQSKVGVSVFYTDLRDIIIRQALPLPDGSTTLIDRGDELMTVGNVNADKGQIKGLSLTASTKLSKQLSIDGSGTWTKGTTTDANGEKSPLGHIPPLYGRLGVSFDSPIVNSSIVYRFNGSKPLSKYGGSVDNPELATPEGTLAWSIFDLYLQYHISSTLDINLSLENLFDQHYRTFASGVSGAGRNLSLSVRWQW